MAGRPESGEEESTSNGGKQETKKKSTLESQWRCGVLGCPVVSTGRRRRRRRRLIKEERGDTDEARWSERGGNAEEAWHCTRDFCRPAAVCNNGCLAAGAEVVGVGAWGREGSARGRSARAAQRQRENWIQGRYASGWRNGGD